MFAFQIIDSLNHLIASAQLTFCYMKDNCKRSAKGKIATFPGRRKAETTLYHKEYEDTRIVPW